MDLRAPVYFRGRTSTRLRLVTGSNAPHTEWCAYWVPTGHPLQQWQKVTLWGITLWVNFGQNYRDLGHFVRVTFMAKN